MQLIRDYCPDLIAEEDSSKFKIASERNLKLLLYGLDQRLYTMLAGKEKRIANSIKKLSERMETIRSFLIYNI